MHALNLFPLHSRHTVSSSGRGLERATATIGETDAVGRRIILDNNPLSGRAHHAKLSSMNITLESRLKPIENLAIYVLRSLGLSLEATTLFIFGPRNNEIEPSKIQDFKSLRMRVVKLIEKAYPTRDHRQFHVPPIERYIKKLKELITTLNSWCDKEFNAFFGEGKSSEERSKIIPSLLKRYENSIVKATVLAQMTFAEHLRFGTGNYVLTSAHELPSRGYSVQEEGGLEDYREKGFTGKEKN
jgi:hypothetical protein